MIKYLHKSLSPSQASGKRCKNTSPNRPPTAKLNKTLRNFDSPAKETKISTYLSQLILLLLTI